MSQIPTAAIGLAYAFIILVLVTLLLWWGRMDRRFVLVISIISLVFGLSIQAPLIPLQMQALLLGSSAGQGVPVAVAGLVIIILIVSSALIGRIFCGYACPIGALQELAYTIPTRKYTLGNRKMVLLVHILFTAVFFAAALIWSWGLLTALGVKQFFAWGPLTFSLAIFVGIIIFAILVYRPFCRIICPFGLFSEILATRPILRMAKLEGCNQCGRCSKACPTLTMDQASKSECYLCLRCTEVCKKDTLAYERTKRRKDHEIDQDHRH